MLSDSLSLAKPTGVLSAVIKTEGNYCKLSLKAIEKHKDEENVIATIAGAKETCVNAAVVAVLSELDCVFALEEEQRTALKPFPSRKKIQYTSAWLKQNFLWCNVASYSEARLASILKPRAASS